MKRKWKLKEKITDEIKQKFPDYNPVILQLLHNRGIRDEKGIENFLNPRFESLSSPFKLSDMARAVERIFEAAANDEKITIYADYDADAVTACAVLYRFLKRLGLEADYYIPDRFAEGYGVNAEAVSEIASRGTKLLITVDCGINSVEETKRAKSHGMDVIITDHHEITGELPGAAAVVNPKRGEDKRLWSLTGVGVAFKLVQAMAAALNPRHYSILHHWDVPEFASKKIVLIAERLGKSMPAHWEKWLLDLVAIGTVADCQNLLDENRVLVSFGLRVMKKTRWLGIREIMKNAGIDPSGDFDAFTLGFLIAPRINAAGRIQHAGIAFSLLATDDPAEAAMLAGQLESLNAHRQRLTEQIASEARNQVLGQDGRKVLLAVGIDWPKGVLGLAASRISDEFGRPTIVLEQSGDIATGSARSVGNFNIVAAFAHGKKFLDRYGGHTQAAGLTLKASLIPNFYEAVLQYAQENFSDEDLIKEYEIDAYLDPSEITGALLSELRKFEPFGPGNPAPRFGLSDFTLEQQKIVGTNGRHIKIHAANNGKIYELIGFGHAKRFSSIGLGEKLDFIVEPSFNVWNGRKSIQLKIKDLRKVL